MSSLMLTALICFAVLWGAGAGYIMGLWRDFSKARQTKQLISFAVEEYFKFKEKDQTEISIQHIDPIGHFVPTKDERNDDNKLYKPEWADTPKVEDSGIAVRPLGANGSIRSVQHGNAPSLPDNIGSVPKGFPHLHEYTLLGQRGVPVCSWCLEPKVTGKPDVVTSPPKPSKYPLRDPPLDIEGVARLREAMLNQRSEEETIEEFLAAHDPKKIQLVLDRLQVENGLLD